MISMLTTPAWLIHLKQNSAWDMYYLVSSAVCLLHVFLSKPSGLMTVPRGSPARSDAASKLLARLTPLYAPCQASSVQCSWK